MKFDLSLIFNFSVLHILLMEGIFQKLIPSLKSGQISDSIQNSEQASFQKIYLENHQMMAFESLFGPLTNIKY